MNLADGQPEPRVPRRRPRAAAPHARRPQPGLARRCGSGWAATRSPCSRHDDPGPEQEYEPEPAGEAWVLDQLVQYCRKTTRNGMLLADDPVVRMQLSRARDRRRGREGARGTKAGARTARTSTRRSPRSSNRSSRRRAWRSSAPLGQVQSGEWAPLAGEIDRIYRRSFGNHAGGTSQVKRMVVATRDLGLPR